MFKTLLTLTTFSLLSQAQAAAPINSKPLELEAAVTSISQKNLKGDVIFESEKEGLHVKAHLTGLAPNSTHGIHVHENGECAGPDYKSAGGHFNPDHTEHGPADSLKSHLGDLGNLVADENGEAHIDKVIAHKDMAHVKDMIGKSVIIHSGQDDLKSQPAGNSGDRIGCGVIQSI